MNGENPGSELDDVPRPVRALPSMGVYALVINLSRDVEVRPGRLGSLSINKGVYVYVGSALRPGLLRRRVARHLSKEKTLRWHIDYLTSRPEAAVEAVVAAEAGRSRLECALASCLLSMGFTAPLHRFGSSDCSCPSHLLKPPLLGVEETCNILSKCFNGLGLKAMEAWLR